MQYLEHIRAQEVFKGDVPLCHAVKVGDLLFVSGVPGFDVSGGIAADDFEAQMRQAMDNISVVLSTAGSGWQYVAKVNVLLTRRSDVAKMNLIYADYFEAGRYPARTTSIVRGLPREEFLVEVECIAVNDPEMLLSWEASDRQWRLGGLAL